MLPRSREHCRGRQITSRWYLTCGATRKRFERHLCRPNLPNDESEEPLKPKVGCTRLDFRPPVAGVMVLNADTHSRGSRPGPGKLGLPLTAGAPSRSNTLSGPAESCKITAGNYRLGHVRIAGRTDEEVEGDGCRSFNKLNTYKSRWWEDLGLSSTIPSAPDLIQHFNTQADAAPVHECQMNMPYTHRGRLVSSRREIATQASAHPNHSQPWYQAN